MIFTNKISLDLDRRGDRPCMDAVQGDTARAVELTLLENDTVWPVPQGATAVIRYRRIHGGSGGVYDTMPDGSAAYAVGEQTLTVYLAPQVLAAAGPVELQVTLVKDGAELTCFSFLIHVQENLTDANPGNENYVNLTEHIRATVEDMKLAKREQTVHYIMGDSGSTAGKWLGTCPDINGYYEGLMIAYRSVSNGGNPSTTLDINGLGPVTVKRNGASADINYYYTSGNVLYLTYTVINGTAYWQLTDMWFADTDKRTSSTSAPNSKLLLVGCKTVSPSGVITYTNPDCYIGDDNCLYSGGAKVASMADLPPDVPGYVIEEANRLAEVVHSRQNENTVSFMLGSDIHASLGEFGSISSLQMLESTSHAANGMKIVADQIHLDFAGLLGDYLWDDGETPEQARQILRQIREYFRPAFQSLPQFWCKGNHDGLDDENHQAQLSDGQIFSSIGINNAGAVFDRENKVQGYCYRDFEDYKLRVVCMNTTKDYNIAVDTTQINWLEKVLAVQSGWKVVILSHCPLDWWGTGSAVYQTVASFAANILCNVHGHTHNYATGLVGDTNIPRVAIPNIDFYRANTYADDPDFGESITYSKIADSGQDTAFCVITIDLAQNKLYADHYGAGYDRVVDLNTGESGEEGGADDTSGFTNQIPMATSTQSGTEIYNGIGYQTSRRINSSGEESSAVGFCCTGFIKAAAGDVVRVKNVTLTANNTTYLLTYTTSGSLHTAHTATDVLAAEGNGAYAFTVPSGVAAIRLSVGLIDDSSIVTINQPIG